MPTSLCNVCCDEIDAIVSVEKDGVYLSKECEKHGRQSVRIEENIQFYATSLLQGPEKEYLNKLMGQTALDVTRRCNVQCPNCYAFPNNKSQDPSIEELVETAALSKKGNGFILMGAEPTMRDDLPELVGALKDAYEKQVGIYTNAIRLTDEHYADEFSKVCDFALISLHTRNYLPDPKLFEQKVAGIWNIKERGVSIEHISFSLETLDDLDEVLDLCLEFRGIAKHFRIRTPCRVGISSQEPVFLSQLYFRLGQIAKQRGYSFRLLPSDNNPVHVHVSVDNMLMRLIHFPSIEEINLDHLQGPAYALFVPSLGETNVVHQFVVQSWMRERPLREGLTNS